MEFNENLGKQHLPANTDADHQPLKEAPQPGEVQTEIAGEVGTRSLSLEGIIDVSETPDEPESAPVTDNQEGDNQDAMPQKEISGAGGNGGSEPPKETGSGSEGEDDDLSDDMSELSKVFAEVKRTYVQEHVDRVVEVGRCDPENEIYDGFPGAVIGDLAAAMGAVGATADEIHSFTESAIERMGTETEGDIVVAWTNAYAAGDEAALPIARQAAGVEAAHDKTLKRYGQVEQMPPSYEEAQKVTLLATSGDAEALSLARETASQCPSPDAAVLSLALYAAGDDESLDVALRKVEETIAAAPLENINERAITHQRGLLRAAKLAAIKREDVQGVLKVRNAMEEPGDRALADAQLYGMTGSDESREAATAYTNTYHDIAPLRAYMVDRELAAAGDPAAIIRAQRRVEVYYSEVLEDPAAKEDVLNDLCALHKAGDPDAAPKIKTILREPDAFMLAWTDKLADNGDPELAASIVEGVPQERLSLEANYMLKRYRHEMDPTNLVSLEELLDVTLSKHQRDLRAAAQYIRTYAER